MNELVPPPATSGKSLLERVEDALLPLINLVFLLLMFFIVAGQLTEEPLPKLPGSQQAAQEQPPAADLIVRADGSWVVAGATVEPGLLLSALPEPAQETTLRIAADQDLNMADLEDLLGILEAGGYTEVLLLTEPGA